jgi:hypothetical protein
MPSRFSPAHVVTTTRTYKGKVYYRSHLLRRSFREDGKVKNETLGNLSHLPELLIEIIRRSLQGERFVPVEETFEITSSLLQGHVQAVRMAMKRLEMASLLGSRPSRERDRVLALIAARHLETGGQVLYDLSSSYFEGTHCPLARLGYNRDGKKGLLQVNYGLMTDGRGCPVAVTVHEGNVSDRLRPRRRWMALTSFTRTWRPSAWRRSSVCAITRRWPRWSVRSVRLRRRT